MSLEASCKALGERLRLWLDELEELHRTVIEKPLEGDVVLVDLFSDAADDLLGWVTEASSAAREANESSAYPVNLERARQALRTCHESVIAALERLSSELLSYDRIEELTSLGRERGGSWLAWSKNVKTAAESCRAPAFEVNRAMFGCWQELGERAGTANVSVQATNVGQQITVPASEFAHGRVP
ncbi:MAG TPA: hypothetical protein VN937_18960 [Blastocatellia bacterium]|nr:hypothetical protein [Blastocatellia bacterium]